jgi:hypothetical protein
MQNDKVKELAEKSGLLFERDYLRYEEKQFAEMIIRECIDAMYKRGEEYAHPSAGFYQSETFSQAIKEHFGIK